MAKRKTSLLKTLIIVLVLLLLFGAIAGFAVLKNNVDFDEILPNTFNVKIGGKTILTTASGYKVNHFTALYVDVYSSVFVSKKADYTVKIDVDSSLRFSYVCDNKLCYFTSAEDVSDFFEIADTQSGFELRTKGDSVSSMLRVLNEGSTISFDDENFDYNQTMFWLTVTSKDGVQSFVKIGFSLMLSVDSITLDTEEIIF